MSIALPRCFIALSPAPATRAALARAAVQPAARAVAVPDLHMTLAFLGGITAEQHAALRDALPTLATALPALPCTGGACWPSLARPRVHVLNFAFPEALATLLAGVREAVRACGLPVEARPFQPHVTLARFPKGQAAVAAPPPAPTLLARFDAIALYASAPPGGGARYVAHCHVPLPD